MDDATSTYRIATGTRSLAEPSPPTRQPTSDSARWSAASNNRPGNAPADGDGTEYAARGVIVTLPLNALAGIEFAPELPP